MKQMLIILLIIAALGLNAADVPIIFIHGNKGEGISLDYDENGNAIGGIAAWYPVKEDGSLRYSTVMTRIISEHYGGYHYGLKTNGNPAIDCNMNTSLKHMPDTKRIYNFSYYHPNGKPGVISLNEDSVLVYFGHSYDKSGRKVIYLVAPCGLGQYPPSSYDSSNYWPMYVPRIHIKKIDGTLRLVPDARAWGYVSSWKKGKYAKRLAEFIDKVLTATGASKVDIVAHSMGGLVARVAIKNYGCASKVRKLLMIATPNHPFTNPLETTLYHWFGRCKDWQKDGELAEMNVDYWFIENDISFKDLKTGSSKLWHNFLGYGDYTSEGMATIAGERKHKKIGDQLTGPDDGIVNVVQVNRSSAQFNPVIWASHDYSEPTNYIAYQDIGAKGEESLTECTYTTEFIKAWMIDDRDDIYGASKTCNAHLIPEDEWPGDDDGGALRIEPGTNDYTKSLVTVAGISEKYYKGVPLWKYPDPQRLADHPVYYVDPSDLPGTRVWHMWTYDMKGEVSEGGGLYYIESGSGAYVRVNSPGPWDIYQAGNVCHIRWESNDEAVSQVLKFSSDGGKHWTKIATLNGEARSYDLVVPEGIKSVKCCIRVWFYLDKFTPITGCSGEFIIGLPPYNRAELNWGWYKPRSVDAYAVFCNGEAISPASGNPFLNKISLLAVDHPESIDIGATSDRVIGYKNPISPLWCVDNEGNDRLAEVVFEDGEALTLNRGDTLWFGFEIPESVRVYAHLKYYLKVDHLPPEEPIPPHYFFDSVA